MRLRIARPGFLRSRIEALLTLLLLGIAVLASGSLAGIGSLEGVIGPVARLSVFLVGLIVNVVVLTIAFRMLTEAELRWRDVVPGAVVGGIAWTGLLLIGGWIVDRQIRNASEVYGFFAIVIGLLAWMALAAQVMILAAELNVVLRRRLWPRSLIERPVMTDADRRALSGEATEEASRRDQTVQVGFEGTRSSME